MESNLGQNLNKFIDAKIMQLNSQIKLTKIIILFIKIFSFLLNVSSFVLTCIAIALSWEGGVNTQIQEFKNWTLLLALCLVLIFIVNLTLVFFSPLRKTQEYYRLMGEIKYLWFKFKMNPHYTAQKLKEEIEEAEKYYLAKRKIKNKEWVKRVILGEKE